MRIWLDPDAAGGLSAHPAGCRRRPPPPEHRDPGRAAWRAPQREFTVAVAKPTCGRPASSTNIISRDVNGYPVQLRDVGRAEIGAGDERSQRAGSTAATPSAMGVVKQSTANPLDVSKAVQKTLPKLSADAACRHERRHRQRQLRLHRRVDQRRVPARSCEAIVLVVLVIFFFLRTCARRSSRS